MGFPWHGSNQVPHTSPTHSHHHVSFCLVLVSLVLSNCTAFSSRVVFTEIIERFRGPLENTQVTAPRSAEPESNRPSHLAPCNQRPQRPESSKRGACFRTPLQEEHLLDCFLGHTVTQCETINQLPMRAHYVRTRYAAERFPFA